MPIYEYRCDSCGHLHDALQKLSDDPLTECPDCGASALRRLISAPSFRLKGSGWYETDFKSDKERKRNLAESADAKGGSEDAAKPADAAKDSAKQSGKTGSSESASSKSSKAPADKSASNGKGGGSSSAVA